MERPDSDRPPGATPAAAGPGEHPHPDAFTPAIAHDLREPLRGIRLATSFLREDRPGMDEVTARALSRIDELATRADRLVIALADHARIGRDDLRRAPTDLHALADEVIRTLEGRKAAIPGEVRVVGSLPVASCDRALIGRVVAELVTNGLTFNRSEPRRVEIGALAADPPTVFVRDNGIGIEPRKLDDVFRMFVRLHARDEFDGGIGAGLAIACRVIERHGGTLRAESVPGRGSTLVFTLPPARA